LQLPKRAGILDNDIGPTFCPRDGEDLIGLGVTLARPPPQAAEVIEPYCGAAMLCTWHGS